MTIQFQDTLVFRGTNYPVTDIDITKSPWIHVTNYVSQKRKVSACHRGYIAKWSIVNDTLVLKDLSIFWSGQRELLTFDELFPEDSQGVEASWFSGSIHLPDGEELETTDPLTTPDRFRHFISERTLTLNIVQGRLQSVHERPNSVDESNMSKQMKITQADKLKAKQFLKREARLLARAQKDGVKLTPIEQRVVEKYRNEKSLLNRPSIDSELDKFGLMAMSGQMTEKSKEDWANFFELNYPIADDGDKAVMEVLNKSIMQTSKK